MSLRIETNAEPIPGYRLIERLGSGGFGEVWKAEAPGGLYKAIKFVQRGNSKDDSCAIEQTDPDRSRADQEMKSLSRVKTVHHPYVISLDRFEVVDDCLVIVMELADRTLSDRFKQCRSQGMPGVPRDELLDYLEEAAEALDLMNSLYQLQHLDIKPQNLFLVHNHIKVADFGLVKDVTDQKFMTITGGVTPVYAAPETFDGKFSRQSDQYSLAIVYQEILTGHRPFTGTSMKQLILQHLQNAHDLGPLPVHDRPIVARALSKNPEDRFATCIDFVSSLRRITSRSRPVEYTAGEVNPIGAPMPSERAHPSVNKTVGLRGASGPVKPADPNFSVAKAQLAVGSAPRPIDARPNLPPPPSPSALIGKTSFRSAPPSRPQRRAAEQPMAGIVQPALLVGVGQLGIETLSQLRERIASELGSPFALTHVRMLGIDTEPEVMNKATAGNDLAPLRTQETFLARLQRPGHFLKARDGKLATDTWLNPKLIYRIPREQTGAGLRALGRLAFVDNYRPLAKRLENELHALCSQDTPHESNPGSDLGLRTNRPRVYVVASLTGNTGGGMFVDVAYLLRRLLNEQGHADAEIVGLFYLPRVRRDAVAAGPLANAHASLVELQHYCQPDAVFSAQYETSGAAKAEKVNMTGPALQRCVLLPLPDPEGKLTDVNNTAVVAQAGDFLYRDLATSLGQTFDQERSRILGSSGDEDEPRGPVLESIGACRILWPRHAILEQAGRKLCDQLVSRWMQKDASLMADTIRQWTAESWESLGMRPEDLIERFKQMAEHALQQSPEGLLSEILGPAREALNPGEASKGKPVANMGPIIETMERLDRALGIPDEVRSARQIHSEPALFERSFAEIAHVIADECEQKLAELAVALLEDPNYRLAGAEEALRQFAKTVDQALQSQESLAKELADKAAQLHVRIQQWVDKPLPPNAPTSTHWSFGIARKSPAASASPADLFELLRTYAKTRFHSMILAHLNRLYVGLRGHLSDQIREVGFCRQRLGELLRLLQPQPRAKAPLAVGDRALFPPGCLDLRGAVDQLIQAITIDDLICFDVRMQEWIQTHCQALLQVCMGSSTTVRNLVPAMLHEAEVFLGERLQGASVAEMYLTRMRASHGDDAADMIADDLQRCLDEATPAFGRIRTGNEITVVTFPNCAEGVELKEILQPRFKEVKIVLTETQHEMLFFHDIVSIPWKDLDQLGPIAAEVYQARCAADPSSLHTREDVFDWELILANKAPE